VSGLDRPKLCVNVVMIKDEKILLLDRKEGRLRSWAFPGGKVESGETLEECALREAKEETGIDCKFIKFVSTVHNLFENDFSSLCFFALLEPLSFDFIESHEGPLKWFDVDKLPSNLLPMDKHVVENLMGNKMNILTTNIKAENGKIVDFKWLNQKAKKED